MENFKGRKGSRGGSLSQPSQFTNGGIAGTGVFGMVGTTIRCDANDTSMYCNIMKFFNLLLVAGGVLFIIYIIYSFASPYMKKGK